MIKWIIAFLGYYAFKLPGAILGYMVGSALDGFTTKSSVQGKSQKKVSPADFELNLLSLCSIVIKADGGISKNEMDYVRQYFVRTYGKEKANAIFRTFNKINKKQQISVQPICVFLRYRTRYEVRLQLLHFLFGIAQADGAVSSREALKIQEISEYLQVTFADFESIKAMFIKSANTAYTILEVDKYATDEEVKKAYRKMAKKYHPDRVITENEAIKRGAEEKFKKVQTAYETIQKERGL